MSSCKGWYGSIVTEFLRPGTRSSDRKVPPKIFVIGDSSKMVPEDRVIAALCLGPTSSQPFAASPDADPIMLAASLAGDEGTFVGVAMVDAPAEPPADCMI
jgi:hypothetical protein